MSSKPEDASGEPRKQKRDTLVMKNMRMKNGTGTGQSETEKEGRSYRNLVNASRVLLSGIFVVVIVIAGLLLIFSLNKSPDNSIDTQSLCAPGASFLPT